MLGAIIGDLAGSIYEFEQTKKITSIKIDNIIEDNSFFSDDTILTIAIADAALNNINYDIKLKEYVNRYANYIPQFSPYFSKPFSPGFMKWVKGENEGNSMGNGAMMRISPIGFLFNTREEVIKQSILATIPSHNCKESIYAAQVIALIIFYARNGLSKEEIIKKLDLKTQKPNITKFNYTCTDTLDVCLYSFFHANSFEESIRLTISFGGDTDTNACIVGAMAEAMFGISEDLKQKVQSKLPLEFNKILKCYYDRIENINKDLRRK